MGEARVESGFGAGGEYCERSLEVRGVVAACFGLIWFVFSGLGCFVLSLWELWKSEEGVSYVSPFCGFSLEQKLS